MAYAILEQTNIVTIADLFCRFNPLGNNSQTTVSSTPFAGPAIACVDGDPQQHMDKNSFVAYMEAAGKLSPTLGDIWPSIKMQCISYDVRPYYRYTGPWSANTSIPILWLSNTADPVTPHASAIKMAKGFPGSRILLQDAPGHCSISGFSRCTFDYVKAYFNNATLPPEGTVCDVDVLPFGPSRGHAVAADVQVEAETHAELAKSWMDAGGGLMSKDLMGRISGGGLLV